MTHVHTILLNECIIGSAIMTILQSPYFLPANSLTSFTYDTILLPHDQVMECSACILVPMHINITLTEGV